MARRRWVDKSTAVATGWKRTGRTRKVTKAVVKYVKRALKNRSEMKQFAYAHTNLIPMSSATGNKLYFNWCRGLDVTNTTPFAQGVGGYCRIGNEVLIHSLEVRFKLGYAAVPAASTTVRFIILRDKNPENTTFNPADFIYDVSANAAVHSPYKHNGLDQFHIYRDRQVQVDIFPGSTAAATWNVFNDKQYVIRMKFKNPIRTIFYPDAAAATAVTGVGIQKNALAILFFADTANCNCSNIWTSINYTDA